MAEQKKIHTLQELQKLVNGWDKSILLDAYLNPEGIDASEVPYENHLRKMMADPKAVQELLKTGNKAFVKKYAKSLLKDKGIFDLYEMNIDNIYDSLKDVSGDDEFKKEDILNQAKPYLDIDGKTLKAIAKVNGWDHPAMLKLIEEEQTKQARKNIYDETNPLTKVMFPRITKSVRDTGDFETGDVVLDIGENALQLIPLGGAGRAVAGVGLRSGLTTGEKAARVARGVGGHLVENASVPVVVAGADQFIRNKDGFDWGEFGQQAATGAAVNSAAGKMVKAGLSAIVPDPAFGEWLNRAFDSGDDALKKRLTEINAVISQGRSANPDAYKKAMNELFILKNKKLFTGSNGANIGDYAAANSKAKKVGKNARRLYEHEVEYNAKRNSPWALKVKETEKGLDPKGTYFTNREVVFPHQFVNTQKVGSRSGLLREVGGSTGKDLPEFNVYNQKNLTPGNTLSDDLAQIASEHNSLTFKYPTDFDKIVNDLLANEQTRKAIMRVYGGMKPREAVEAFVLNKLGRSEWLKRGESAAYRTFGEFMDKKQKSKEKE